MRTLSSLFCLVMLSVLFSVGCSDMVQVTGKVTLPDGTPIKNGQIMFEKEGFVAWGEIQRDGTYRMGRIKSGDGIPLGEYGIYFSGVVKEIEQMENKMATRGMDGKVQTTTMSLGMPIPLLEPKFDSIRTSGLTCSVTKSTVYNVEVELREK